MPLPTPNVPLEHICSTIHDNILYTYSATAFQSLPLTEGAKWENLAMGEAVEGAVCVESDPTDPAQAAFYVVGGSMVADAAVNPIPPQCQGKYRGLQKFTYATKQWETICPTAYVTEDRKSHGATYIKDSDALLVFAGRQDGGGVMSSETFTIQASGDHSVQSFDQAVPPASKPILLPWSGSQAVMVGGDETNRKVTLFGVAAGWTDSGATIADPLPARLKAALVNGDDASKHLYTFDMTASPNVVNRIALLDGSGNPITQSATITPRHLGDALSHWDAAGLAQRDLKYGDWPAYNSTLAPPSTRSDYAIAQDSEGQIVFAGGSDDDILCIFDGRTNTWQNPTEKLAAAAPIEDGATTVISLSLPADATSTASPSPTAAGSDEITAAPTVDANVGTSQTAQQHEDFGMSPNVVLGIALGSILGAVIIFGLLIFFIRWKQRKKHLEAGHARRDSGAASPEKSGFGFASNIPPRPAPAGGGHFRGHQQSASQDSYSSIAILMGKVANPSANAGHKTSNESRRSSTSSLFNREFKATISNPIPQQSSFNPPLLMVEDKAVSFAPDTRSPQPRQPPADVQAGGARRSSGWNRYWSGGSMLNSLGLGTSKRTTVDLEDEESSKYSEYRITQDSVTIPALQLEGRAEMNRVNTGNPAVLQHPIRNSMKGSVFGRSERPVSDVSGYSSGIPASVPENWEPPSAESTLGGGSDQLPANLGPGGASVPAAAAQRPAQTGLSRQPQLALAAKSSDMSWLNLGPGPGPDIMSNNRL